MAFCRMCGTELDEGERYCHRCGTPVGTVSIETHPASSHASIFKVLGDVWRRYSPTVLLAGLIMFSSYVLLHQVIQTKVVVQLLDEYFHMMILSQLHLHPTESWYSIADPIFRKLYTNATPESMFHFPLIFYVWLLVPTVDDIRYLYFVFALGGVVASYFAVYAVTKQSLVAFLSGVWMAYFMQTAFYLMLEYWAVSVFLIGMALFLMKRHLWAAAAIGLATLIKEVFAVFLVCASLYYLVTTRKEWWPHVQSLMMRERRIASRFQHSTGNMQVVYVWLVATGIVGFLYYLDGLASQGFTGAALGHNFWIHISTGFHPEVLPLFFSGIFFRIPPVPAFVAVALALAGMAFLDRDHSIIMYASFALLPIMLLLGMAGLTFVPARPDNVPRYVAMSVTMVNLFWLVGVYKICEVAYLRMRGSKIRLSHR